MLPILSEDLLHDQVGSPGAKRAHDRKSLFFCGLEGLAHPLLLHGALPETQRQIDCAGRATADAPSRATAERFLIGHLCKSLLVRNSNTGFEPGARLLGGSQGHLLVVAGGFGEDPASPSAAAETAIGRLTHQFLDSVPTFFGLDREHETELKRSLEAAVASCHHHVLEAGRQSGDATLGASLTAVYVLWPRIYLVHLGETRCYLIRGAEVRQLTRDHVRRLSASIAAGDSAPGQGPQVLTNALGAGIEHPQVDFSRVALDVEDTLVLCTAGLVEALGEETRLAESTRSAAASRSVDTLIEAASATRESFGAALVVARFVAPPAAPQTTATTSEGPSGPR